MMLARDVERGVAHRVDGSCLTSEALRWTIALAHGRVPRDGAATPDDWRVVREVARIERCLGVAWLRSGRFIRGAAPPDVAASWRAEVAALDDASRRQFERVIAVVRRLEAGGLGPVILKGAPLSLWLYGDPFARHSADIDLFVAAAERGRAHELLLGDGWRHDGGEPPDEALYWSADGGIRTLLELHSSLADDELLRAVRMPPPQASTIVVDGVPLPAHLGPSLAVHLAVHLAKHTSAPILWLVDFATLWARLGSADRLAARAIARTARAERHLDWCIARAAALDAAAAGDRHALRRCGGMCGVFRERHGVLRNALLAENRGDGARLVASWASRRLWNLGRSPREMRGRLAWLERLASRFRQAGPAAIESDDARAGSAAARVVVLDAPTSLALVRDCLATGASAWLVARGSSMWPTIHSGARVRIAPLCGRPLRPGDVALIETAESRPVLHRVMTVAGDQVVLRGDNMACADDPIAIQRVIGVATHAERDGRAVPLARGRWWPRMNHWCHRVVRGVRTRITATGGRA